MNFIKKNFIFSTELSDGILVPPDQLYQENGYGFVTEENRKEQPSLQIPELNNAFCPAYWAVDFPLTQIGGDLLGCFAMPGNEFDARWEIPLFFKASIPHAGNYRVTVSLAADQEYAGNTLLFLGRRRLAFHGPLIPGEVFHKTFLVNVCPIIPRGYPNPMEQLTMDVTLLGRGSRLQSVSIEPVSCPTLYIGGDSTVTDQSADYPYLPENSYSGWGQMLGSYLKEYAVSNHSHSGLTTETFRSEGHYKILLDAIQPGDLCLLQFAHNDQKLAHLKAREGYRDNILRYLEEIRRKGAHPVLVTPLARNTWKNSKEYHDFLEEYETVCNEIGEEENVPVLQLHRKSMSFLLKQGRDKAKHWFYPSDYSHSNDCGAFLFAGYVAEELWDKGILKKPEGPALEPWNPNKEISPIVIPPEAAHKSNPEDIPLFESLERPEELLTRAEAFELVIAALHFFPTNVYNDVFEDVIGHELFAGTIECAWQNGLIPDAMILNSQIQPEKLATTEELLCIAMLGYQCRCPLPEHCQPLQEVSPWAKNPVEAAGNLGLIPEGLGLKQPITRKEAADICKKIPF